MAKFKAFKPQAMERIARSMGYTGEMSGFQQYLDSNVSLKERMKQLEDSAMEMSKNGTIKQTQKQSKDTVGAFVPPPTQTFDPVQMQQGGVIGSRPILGITTTPPNTNLPNKTNLTQPLPQQYIPQAQYQQGQQIQDLMAKQAQAPALPMGSTLVPQGTLQEAGQMVNPATGQEVQYKHL